LKREKKEKEEACLSRARILDNGQSLGDVAAIQSNLVKPEKGKRKKKKGRGAKHLLFPGQIFYSILLIWQSCRGWRKGRGGKRRKRESPNLSFFNP